MPGRNQVTTSTDANQDFHHAYPLSISGGRLTTVVPTTIDGEIQISGGCPVGPPADVTCVLNGDDVDLTWEEGSNNYTGSWLRTLRRNQCLSKRWPRSVPPPPGLLGESLVHYS